MTATQMKAVAPTEPRGRLRQVLSLLLLTLTMLLAILWIHSIWWRPFVSRRAELPRFAHEEFLYTSSHNGRYYLCYAYRHEERSPTPLAPPARWSYGSPRASENPPRYGGPALLALVGIDGFYRFESDAMTWGHLTIREVYFTMPYWLLVMLTAAGGWRLGRPDRVRRRRTREGRCVACEYDIRATPDRCPECGYEPLASAERRHGN